MVFKATAPRNKSEREERSVRTAASVSATSVMNGNLQEEKDDE